MTHSRDPLPGERPPLGSVFSSGPSITRRVARDVVDAAAAGVGVPLALHRALAAAAVVPADPLERPASGIAASAILRWDRWYRRSLPKSRHFPWRGQPGRNALRWSGRHPNIVSREIEIGALNRLCRHEVIEDFRCDARDIECLGASKSPLVKIGSLDEMATRRSPELVREITPESLEKNMAHEARSGPFGDDGAVLDRFGWDGRLCLRNDGGSHHFAAARYLAGRLGVPLPIRATLHEYRFDADAVGELDATYRIFLVTDENMSRLAIGDALRDFGATFVLAALPPPHERLTALFLPRSVRRSRLAAGAMDRVGQTDLGRLLETVSQRGRNVRSCSRGGRT